MHEISDHKFNLLSVWNNKKKSRQSVFLSLVKTKHMQRTFIHYGGQ